MQPDNHLSDTSSDDEEERVFPGRPPRWTPFQDPRLALLPPHARPDAEVQTETERVKMVIIRLLPIVATFAVVSFGGENREVGKEHRTREADEGGAEEAERLQRC
jgi:hypothetical protein